jgi:hypothetical protein
MASKKMYYLMLMTGNQFGRDVSIIIIIIIVLADVMEGGAADGILGKQESAIYVL